MIPLRMDGTLYVVGATMDDSSVQRSRSAALLSRELQPRSRLMHQRGVAPHIGNTLVLWGAMKPGTRTRRWDAIR